MSDESEVSATRIDHNTFLRVALDVLSARVLRWVVLAMCFALYGYVSLRPHWIPLVAASAFTLIFGLPSFWRGGK